LLETFQKCTKKLESDNFGTISYVFQALYLLVNAANNLKKQHMDSFNAFNEKLIKFKTYFQKEMYPLVHAATILNPLIPLKVLEPQELECGMTYIRQKMIMLGWQGISSIGETGVDDDGFEITKKTQVNPRI
jgi:hypothetical protein